MVLYYGLLALETANNTVGSSSAGSTSRATIPRVASDRTNLSRKQKYLSNSIGKMPSSSLSSSNSWIYTEDLRKRFEERYADHRYIFVPVYVDRKSARHFHSTTGFLPEKLTRENSWMYSKSLRDHLFYSTSKISLPVTTNISSSACCVTNHGFMRDELPIKKDFKSRLFKRSSSAKEKSSTNLSLSNSSFSTINNLVKHRTNDVVEEEDDEESIDNENHSIPLIKHDSMLPLSTSRAIPLSSADNNVNINSTNTNELALSKTKSPTKHAVKHNNKLTRLRSFFFKSSSPSLSRTSKKTLSSSSCLPNTSPRT